MNRRNFLARIACSALAVPAFVRAASLWLPPEKIVVSNWWEDEDQFYDYIRRENVLLDNWERENVLLDNWEFDFKSSELPCEKLMITGIANA